MESNKPGWKASVFVIMSLVLVILMITLALRPTLVTIATLLGEIREQKDIAMQLNRKIQNLQMAADNLEINKDQVALLDLALPTTPDIAAWVESVQALTSETGVTMDSLSLGNTVFAKKIQSEKIEVGRTSFSASISGDYNQITGFLSKLENLLRVTIVSDVQISKNDTGLLLVSIKGAIGYEKK